MESRTISRLVLTVVFTVLAGCVEPTADHVALYYLEVANDAAHHAFVRVRFGHHTDRGLFYDHKFKDMATGVTIPYGSGSGILALMSGERRTFEATALDMRDSAEDNGLVRSFSRIEFFEESSDAPYRIYYYLIGRCRDIPSDSDCSDDAWTHRRYRDLKDERLFVESPNRPFYLERDKEDPELGRIVITFVPSAEGTTPHARTNITRRPLIHSSK